MEGEGDFGANFGVKTGQFTWCYSASKFWVGCLILDPGLVQGTIDTSECSDFQIVTVFMKPTV